jgi:hypothetical protein
VFPTGFAEIDGALHGGISHGSLLVVIGPHRSGKTDFLIRFARSNGIIDAHAMNQGMSDMLSICRRPDGQYIGSIVLNCLEPSTDAERARMGRDPASRDRFLSRWFDRSKAVLRQSGGIFALTVESELEAQAAAPTRWMAYPDHIVQADRHTYRLIKPTDRGRLPQPG